jgi:translation initiation factor 5A
LVGLDIFTGRRYEDVRPTGHMIQVPNVRKKDYVVVNIDEDGYVTLLNEDTCAIRSDMKLKEDSDITRRMLDKFNEGNGQMKVTVLKALGEEQIMAFKMID